MSKLSRYLIERNFPQGFQPPEDEQAVHANNTAEGVFWVQSFITEDARKTFCIYDAPNPEAIRRAAKRNGLPADRIHRVQVLTPHVYTPSAKAA